MCVLFDRRPPAISNGNGHRRVPLADARPSRHPRCECAAGAAVPSVLLASAIPSVRKAWRAGVRGLNAVEVADHGQLVCSLTPHAPAVLLLDLDLPNLGGMNGLPGLRALQPQSRIVVLAGCPDDKQGLAALKLGVQGYCDRAISPSLLAKAVEAVRNGEVWVGRKLTSHLLDELSALTESMEEPARPRDQRSPARPSDPARARDRRRAGRGGKQQGHRPEVLRDGAHGQGASDRGVPEARDPGTPAGRRLHGRARPFPPSQLTRSSSLRPRPAAC